MGNLINRRDSCLTENNGSKAPPLQGGFLYRRYTYTRTTGVSMLVFEAKLEGEKQQYEMLDEAIR
ncbi:hypothetical protein, partial [Aerosakkonema sp. BLCC-F183]|uniref:hypothetical protein n=1 Tax=Aerosakkonema sp. BLCC-F183 TaxID=3342834 RepID=UPI0035BC9150